MITRESGQGNEKELISQSGSWFPGWDNFPASAYIDLGKEYNVSKLSFEDLEGEGDFLFEVGQPNAWFEVWRGATDKRGLQEKALLAKARFVRITLLEAGANINDLHIYGEEIKQIVETHNLEISEGGSIIHTLPVSEDVGISFKKIVEDKPEDTPDPQDPPDQTDPPIIPPTDTNGFRKTLDAFIGTNVLADDPHNLVAPVAGNIRVYQWLKWLNKDVSNTDPNKPLSQVMINFNPNDAWGFNHDQSTKGFAEIGETSLTLFESSMRQTNNDKTWLNAVAYRRQDGRDGLDKPERWKYLAHLYYQVAARYGHATVDESRLLTESQKLSGLGYCTVIEGPNEADRWWIGKDKADLSPEEHAALHSMLYDGHMNKVKENGVYFGVKNADPSLKLMLGGLAYVNFDELLSTGKVEWFERFFRWFENNRKDPNYDTYPIDIIAYHDYPNTIRQQRNIAGIGLDPETYRWYQKTKAFVEYINNRCPKPLQVDNNEFGYDRNQSSPQRAVPYSGFSSEQVAGFWTIRCMLEGWAAGLTRGVQFYFRDNNANGGGIFQSSGLTDKSNGYKPFQMYYYMATTRAAMSGHDFVSREVIGDMIKYQTVHRETGKKGYILWHFSKQNKQTNYRLNTSAPILETRLKENSTQGEQKQKTPASGVVNVLVTELPTFLTET